MDRRAEKLNNLIKRVLAELILKEFCVTRDVIISLTYVDTSEDFAESKIFISTIPNDSRKKVVNALNKDAYIFQKMLNKKLRMRPVPRIKFFEDEKPEQAEAVEKILSKIGKEQQEG
jgi:ribosome-binding factor A